MKPTIRIHQPRPATALPAHEIAARRRRATASLPLLRKPKAPKPPVHRGRKTFAY